MYLILAQTDQVYLILAFAQNKIKSSAGIDVVTLSYALKKKQPCFLYEA